MGKFAIECPKCGTVNTASTFILAKKVIKCGTCHNDINVKEARLMSKVCPHCGKVFVYDQAKGHKKDCPSCGKRIDANKAETVTYKMTHINCPQCSCTVEVDKNAETYACPICNCEIEVQKELVKEKLVKDLKLSVLEYQGDNSTFVWKHPIEDFNYGSTLIVRESQEAIFLHNGEALDPFGPGSYKLETDSIPLLNKLQKLATDGHAPYSAEVYFVNKAVQMGVKWGTDSRVRFIDPITGIPLDIGASGEMSLQVIDGKKLLLKLVGTTGGISNKEVLTEDGKASAAHKTLQRYFRAPLMTEVKAYLANVIKDEKINILEIDAHMGTLSEALRKRIAPKFEEYGLTVPEFYITNIALPEDDKNFKDIKALISQAYISVKAEEVRADIAEAAGKRKKTEAQVEADLNLINAKNRADVKLAEANADIAAMRARGLAEAEIMRAKGYTEKDLIDADVQKTYAENMGAMAGGANVGNGGSMVGDVLGTMVNMKMAGTVINKMDDMLNNSPVTAKAPSSSPSPETWACECGEFLNTKKFCMSCGKARPEPKKADTWDCACGETNITSKFCPECGAPKPVPAAGWNCSCGKTDITSKFCPECGSPKPADPEKWDCACGKKGIESKFCPECGSKKGE
ncbi:MAG: SPFH domain-containing protein [Clostridia bacterium]|nr:SPFH domain-containing protein [Clostridia bacterium]